MPGEQYLVNQINKLIKNMAWLPLFQTQGRLKDAVEHPLKKLQEEFEERNERTRDKELSDLYESGEPIGNSDHQVAKDSSELFNQYNLAKRKVVKSYLDNCKKSKIIPDFEGVDLTGIDLSDLDFSGANLKNAILNLTDCSKSNFKRANINGADFSGALSDSIRLPVFDKGIHFFLLNEGKVIDDNANKKSTVTTQPVIKKEGDWRSRIQPQPEVPLSNYEKKVDLEKKFNNFRRSRGLEVEEYFATAISDEEMAFSSAFGRGSHTAKAIQKRSPELFK